MRLSPVTLDLALDLLESLNRHKPLGLVKLEIVIRRKGIAFLEK